MQTQSNTSNHQNAKAAPKMKHSDINPVVAGVAGAIVGAGIGVAGAVAMRDEKINKKAHQVAKAVGDKASEYAQSMKEEATNQLEGKAGETEEEVKKIVSSDRKN
jgi:gas vesicle protein